MVLILDGKNLADKINKEIIEEVKKFKENGISPTLGVIWTGEDADTLSYVNSIEEFCTKMDISTVKRNFSDEVDENEFLKESKKMNGNPDIHGIIFMRPLPPQIKDEEIANLITPEKDIDCIGYANMAKVFGGIDKGFAPCTAESVIEILKYYHVELEGKNAVIIGRSLVIGRPVAMMLLEQNATVTICHSKTDNLQEIARGADILVTALGKPCFINSNFIKKDAIIVDVGMNEFNGKMVGDVDYDDVIPIAGKITPVPGGVGPVTTSILLRNLMKAIKMQR